MAFQQGPQPRINPHAQVQYDLLCEKHGLSPTTDDVEAIKGITGPVNIRPTIGGQFEAALLFFLPKSNVQFEQGALLIGWTQEDNDSKLQVWFKLHPNGKGSLYRLPSGSSGSRYCPDDDICDEWHPDIFDIVGWDDKAIRFLQYAYLRSCVRILEATVPLPSIEDPTPTFNDSALTNSNVVDLTGSDEEVDIKPEQAPTSAKIPQVLDATVEERVQAFRGKLENKEVNQLQQMLEKRSELPSWIMDLAKEVLRKKMLKELELAESLLL